jgi:hypothetical protein
MTTPTTPADVERLIDDYQAIVDCSPDTPWSGCSGQTVSNLDHYDGHHSARFDALLKIFTVLRELASQVSALQEAGHLQRDEAINAVKAVQADRDAAVALLRQLDKASCVEDCGRAALIGNEVFLFLADFDARQAPQP